MLTKKTRDRLLSVASMLDSFAARIRAYVKAQTPKRSRAEVTS